MIVFRVVLFILKLYAKSMILPFLILRGRYRVGILHVPVENSGMKTWLITLMPDSIVFESDNSYLHVHEISFKKR